MALSVHDLCTICTLSVHYRYKHVPSVTCLYHVLLAISLSYHDNIPPMAEICQLLQESYRYLASGDVAKAKKACISAAKLSKSADLQVAKFTVAHFDSISKDGSAVLSQQEKIQWLLSQIQGSFWPPVFSLGPSVSSLDLPPSEVPTDCVDVPEFNGFSVSFQQMLVSLEISLDGLAEVYQDLLPNCSFVLSVLAIIDLGLQNVLVDAIRVFPSIGAAKVKLYINGCFREVTVSTVLPMVDAPHSHRSLIMRSHSNNTLLWPALIEKAFLAAVGQSYRFSGSNMAEDMHTLLAWPPEVRKTSKMSLDLFATLWNLRQNHAVSLGLGTGPMSPALASLLGVVPEHDYVVCGYDGQTLKLQNPWCSRDSSEPHSHRFLNVDLAMFAQFTYVYVNWNPAKFSSKSTTPIICPAVPPAHPFLLLDCPQFEVFNNSESSHELLVAVEHNAPKWKDHQKSSVPLVSVYESRTRDKVVHSLQYPIIIQGRCSHKTTFFARIHLLPECSYKLVVTDGGVREVLTLKTYSNIDTLHIGKPALSLPRICPAIEDSWAYGYNGGSWIHELYVDNPQWDMVVGNDVENVLLLLTCPENANISIHIFNWDQSLVGKKLRNFDKAALVHCEDYTRSFHEALFSPEGRGVYRVVVSCYDAAYKGSFRLLAMHNGIQENSVLLEKTPQTYNLYEQSLAFDWNMSNRHKYAIFTKRPKTNVTFHFRQGNLRSQETSGYRPAVRASVFDGISKLPVVVNEKWNDSVYGVFVDCTLPIADHQYILLVERFDTGSGLCRVNAWSSDKLDVEEVG